MALVEALTGAGYNVQLVHDDTETTWESHGWVSIMDSSANCLTRNEDVQHNRKYSQRAQTLQDMAAAAIAAMDTHAAVAGSPLARTTSPEAAAAV
jgi:hypothetical protein